MSGLGEAVRPFETLTHHADPLDRWSRVSTLETAGVDVHSPAAAELSETSVDGQPMHAGPRRVDDDVFPLTLGADERVDERLRGGLMSESFDFGFAAAHDEVTRAARSRPVGL